MSATGGQIDAIERVEHIVPRISDRQERERRRRPFPELEHEEGGETPRQEPRPRPAPPPAEGDPEHRVDLVVRGRFLPTGQDLPDCTERLILH